MARTLRFSAKGEHTQAFRAFLAAKFAVVDEEYSAETDAFLAANGRRYPLSNHFAAPGNKPVVYIWHSAEVAAEVRSAFAEFWEAQGDYSVHRAFLHTCCEHVSTWYVRDELYEAYQQVPISEMDGPAYQTLLSAPLADVMRTLKCNGCIELFSLEDDDGYSPLPLLLLKFKDLPKAQFDDLRGCIVGEFLTLTDSIDVVPEYAELLSFPVGSGTLDQWLDPARPAHVAPFPLEDPAYNADSDADTEIVETPGDKRARSSDGDLPPSKRASPPRAV